jgi:hypothetical protein
VKRIGEFAFYNTKWLDNERKKNSLVIVNNILIDGSASKGKVTIPKGITSIGDAAFWKCENLTSITIPASVKSIGKRAFEKCYGLKSITIPNGVNSIADRAFYECSNLKSITIPNNVKSIGDSAFDWCMELTIYGKKASKAESYAKENKIKFVIK